MRLDKQNIKKTYYFIIAAAVLFLFAAVNIYIKINAANTGNLAYKALINNDLTRLSKYVHFIKNKDISINGKSLLIYAVELSNSQAVKILADAGADCDKPVENNTALLEALRENKFDIASELILNYGGDVNSYISDNPYIAILADENNFKACEFLLNQKDINTQILVQNEPLSVHLYKNDKPDTALSNLFVDKLYTDKAFSDYIDNKYNILSLGGANAIVTGDDTVAYIIAVSGKNGKQTIILFDAEKFSRNVHASLSVDKNYIAFCIDLKTGQLSYISGIHNFSSLFEDTKSKILTSVSNYLNANTPRILGIKNDNIFSASALLHIKDNKKYSVDDMFSIDDEVFETIARNFVNITSNADKNKIQDISYRPYYSDREVEKAKKTMYFALRLFPMSLVKEIDNIYLVASAKMQNSDIAVNGAFCNNNNIVIASADNHTAMATTYIHEFSHFITKNSDRKNMTDITEKYSKYGYYEDYNGQKYYNISCAGGDGKKKDFFAIYSALIDIEQNVFRKDGFVQQYAAYNSWEDFAVTAESMFSFADKQYFIDYAKKKGYNAIEKKFDCVKEEFNKYNASKGGDSFMSDEYFEKVKHYLISYKYNYPQILP